MKLSEKQQLFTQSIAQLINYATARGWGLTFGDAYRDHRLHGGMGQKKSYSSTNSNHKFRLAVDFNLFVCGRYITSDCQEYQDLGAEWKKINGYARWGGDFKSMDLNHFSFEHSGYQ